MTGGRWRRVEELFGGAMEVPAARREAWVREASAGDAELAEEVLSLLASDAAAGEGFVAGQVAPAVAKLMEGGGLMGAPVRVGPYRLVSELGRGGMGTVYLAERDDDQYQTQVAIKLVRRGMDTDLILHRFYRERQTLARLQHPHIARLLDGGTTPEGLPYIVMEYVKGTRITDYCRERGLPVRARLGLFLDVCDAVGYAHRQFVIHRDLKPGNILVDEAGAVKLLDFGICKLLHAEPVLGEETMEAGPAPLTPEYASPEQILGEPTNIASDVYSLGAVLYELLTGAKPHRIADYSLRGIEAGICQAEIVRPHRLVKSQAGDLDNIVMQALQKDPARRYASIEQFAEDIRRHLTDQPVKARSDTWRYRVGKFVRRRKGLVAAAAAVLVTLLAGVVVSVRSARKANENLGLVRQLSNTFVFDVYDAVQELPGSTKARELIVRTGLEYLDNLSRNAGGDSELQRELASAYRRIGDVQGNVSGANLGKTEEALASYRKALELLDAVVAREGANRKAEAERVTVHGRIGALLTETKDAAQGMASYEKAEQLAEQLLARYPEDARERRRVAEIQEMAAHAERRRGRLEAARERNGRALALLKPLFAATPEDPELLAVMASAHSGMALSERQLGHLAEAKAENAAAVAIMKRLAESDPSNMTRQRELMIGYSNMGDVLGNPNLRNLGDRAGAAEAYGRMRDLALRIFQADPADQRAKSDYAIALVRLATVTPDADVGRRTELLQRAAGLQEELAQASPNNRANRAELLFTYNFLGDAYATAGNPAVAEKTWRAGLRQGEPMLDSGSITVVTACVLLYRKLGEAAALRGDRTTALALAGRVMELTDPAGKGRSEAVQRLLTPRGTGAMGLVYAALARSEPSNRAEARRWLEKSLEQWSKVAKPGAVSEATRREIQALEKALEGVK